MSITVLLVDDHEVVRQGLRALLENESDIELIGEVSTGEEALTSAKTLKPDVMIVDLALPGISGFEVARQISSGGSETKVLVLSMHADDAYVLEALRSGASGYVLKESPAAELVDGIRAAAEGQHYLSTSLSQRALESFLGAPDAPPRGAFSSLTKREVQVLALVADGLTSREIGNQLDIGTRTVETHRAHIMHKLGLRSHGDLVGFAVRYQLLTKPGMSP